MAFRVGGLGAGDAIWGGVDGLGDGLGSVLMRSVRFLGSCSMVNLLIRKGRPSNFFSFVSFSSSVFFREENSSSSFFLSSAFSLGVASRWAASAAAIEI